MSNNGRSFYQIRSDGSSSNNSNGNSDDKINSNANSSTSTLRPRNNRLISYGDSSGYLEDSESTNVVTSPSRYNTRSLSPSSAATTGLRFEANTRTAALRDANSHKRNASDLLNPVRRSSGGIWEPWSSLTGMASSFLTGDAAGPGNKTGIGAGAGTGTSINVNGLVRRSSSTNTKRSSMRMLQEKNYNLRQAQPAWGPAGDTDPKPKSIEEQRALLQVKRREILLAQGIAVEAGKDSLGRFKRKDSNASIRSPVDPSHLDQDILVYRHRVQPRDTMAGVVIKYSCQPEAFRKINRFWPNDNIQRKNWVVLPIDACAVKGRKTESPYIQSLDVSPTNAQSSSSSIPVDIPSDSTPTHSETEPFPSAGVDGIKDSASFRHDSWVLLPTFDQPVEILRISKKDLGYFPPARRKSPSASASQTPFTDSNATTPRTSFDTLRHPPTHAAQQAQLNQQLQTSLSLNNSPIRQPSLPRLMSATRTRSSSTLSTTNSNGQNGFLSALNGPGGVGTLRGLRTERARPGPADDPLNKKFAQYFPDQLPQDHPDYQDSNRLRPPHVRMTSNTIRATPRASTDSARSTRSNSSTIAGWMGKVASSPMRKKSDLRLDRSDLNLAFDGRPGGGDLIELSDTPDEVSRQLHDAVGEPSNSLVAANPAEIVRQDEENSVSVDQDDALNKRFPVRGRVMRAYEHD